MPAKENPVRLPTLYRSETPVAYSFSVAGSGGYVALTRLRWRLAGRDVSGLGRRVAYRLDDLSCSTRCTFFGAVWSRRMLLSKVPAAGPGRAGIERSEVPAAIAGLLD